MASATAVKPPPTDPEYRQPLEPSGPLQRAASDADAGTTATPAAGAPLGRSRRVVVILHGKRADEADVRAAVKRLREEGVQVDVKVTWESGDVETFVKDIVKAHSADTIVAAGGDGTLNEVVAGLIKVRAPRHIAVGLMPMGTSNDFAAVTGIPQDLEGALRLCCRSDNLRPLDVGLLNGEVFMNTATLGASSELGSETSHEAKKLLGPAAYLVTGVARLAGYSAVPVRMRFPTPEVGAAQEVGEEGTEGEAQGASGASGSGADAGASGASDKKKPEKKLKKSGRGFVEVQQEVLNLTAGNNRQLASMVQACPDALLDDGLLDIMYVTGGAIQTAGALMGEILTRGLDEAQPDSVHILRVPWLEVTLEAEDPALSWPGNRDGEPVPSGRRFLLEALPRRITMHLPDAARALLTEGADTRVNAPVISLSRLRKGGLKRMLAQLLNRVDLSNAPPPNPPTRSPGSAASFPAAAPGGRARRWGYWAGCPPWRWASRRASRSPRAGSRGRRRRSRPQRARRRPWRGGRGLLGVVSGTGGCRRGLAGCAGLGWPQRPKWVGASRDDGAGRGGGVHT